MTMTPEPARGDATILDALHGVMAGWGHPDCEACAALLPMLAAALAPVGARAIDPAISPQG